MDSGVTIKDLNSAHGTFIDGVPVSESSLLPGQSLQLGEVRLQLEAVSAAAAAVPASGPAQCKFHPRNPAHYVCPKCHQHYCEMCVNTRPADGQTKYFCRACAVACTPLTPATAADDPAAEAPFLRQILGAFKYPLKGDGMVLIAIGTVFFLVVDGAKALAKFAPLYGLCAFVMLTVFGTGYLFAYLRRILNATALGDEELPEWPEMEGIVATFFEFVGTVLFCFAPAIGLTIYASYAALSGTGDGDTSWLGWVTTASICIGCAYFPMAFMAVAMFDSIGAINPLLVIPSILKVLKTYLLTVAMLAVILVLRWLLNNHLASLLPVPLLPTLLTSLLGLYLLVVEMRILGLLYRHKKAELGWFN
jgi:hypothetical protein